MENNNNNRLTDENQKWLDDLLNAPDSQEVGAGELAKQFAHTEGTAEKMTEEEQAIWEAEALVAGEPAADIDDADIEEILAEDWLNEDAQTEQATGNEPAATEEAADTEAISETDGQFPRRRPKKEIEQKRRPKRTDGYGLLGIPHILSTVIWAALILAIGISLGRVLWVCCADMMAFGKEPQTVTITITSDDTAESIAKKLNNASLIRYPKLFEKFITLTGKDEDIGVGTFTLNSQLDYNAMVNAMYTGGSRREAAWRICRIWRAA